MEHRQITNRWFARLALLPLVAIAVAGCATKFTGGGTILSTDGTHQANFGFTYKVTDTSTGAGDMHGAYQDLFASGFRNGGVQLKFDGLLSSALNPETGRGMDGIEGTANYISQNPNYPGSGTVEVSACDSCEPGPDFININVTSGPYSGYSDNGDLTGGNLQAHN
jgi:hypothetical protein